MRQVAVPDRIDAFETVANHQLTPGRVLIARLVGRRFDQLLEQRGFEKPYDPRFGKAMVKTLAHLVTSLGATFGLAARTELSLYAVSAGGEGRRLLSRIAGEAAAKLSLLTGHLATFDARLFELPDVEHAVEFFGTRQQAAQMEAIDRYCTHVLSQSGADATAVPRILEGLGPEEKVELLRQNGLDFSTVPMWQRRGACVRLLQPEAAVAGGAELRARLMIDLVPPSGDNFAAYLRAALLSSGREVASGGEAPAISRTP